MDTKSCKNLNEQKKSHQKILIFDEVVACQSSPFYTALKNDLKFSHGIWHIGAQTLKWTSRLDLYLSNYMGYRLETYTSKVPP